MTDNDRVSLKVDIGGRSYSLRIPIQDEQKLYKATQQINEKLAQYRGRYTDKDMQDFFAMTALQLATKLIELEDKNLGQKEESTVIQNFRELSKELDTYLQSVQRS